MRHGEIKKIILGNEKATIELDWKATHSLQEVITRNYLNLSNFINGGKTYEAH